MRKKYTVRWAHPAIARKIIKRIRERISNLKMAPERGRVAPELAKHGITQYREMKISPWRIFYQIDENVVYVVLVVDGRRNLEDILFQRLMR
jgi:toxin ParE1/3/4